MNTSGLRHPTDQLCLNLKTLLWNLTPKWSQICHCEKWKVQCGKERVTLCGGQEKHSGITRYCVGKAQEGVGVSVFAKIPPPAATTAIMRWYRVASIMYGCTLQPPPATPPAAAIDRYLSILLPIWKQWSYQIIINNNQTIRCPSYTQPSWKT